MFWPQMGAPTVPANLMDLITNLQMCKHKLFIVIFVFFFVFVFMKIIINQKHKSSEAHKNYILRRILLNKNFFNKKSNKIYEEGS